MKVTSAELQTVAVKPEQFPTDQKPEIALSGRSNVGKSSFINTMLGRKALARTSQKPGKTQTLNFYGINELFYFVDVPGYGYAKVSKSERARWGKMMEQYFSKSETLRGVIQLVDFRHPPSEDDVQMYEFLKYYEVPVLLVATKMDKVKKTQVPRHMKQLKQAIDFDENDRLVLFSSVTGQGKVEAWRNVLELIHS
ncbi:YihA family ribosome biogenesis GTP-binding protein [Bacillaceae bacterium SIJ1]|uniref:ribosome biogenesis GTP-binding protein YihA/YsxC n=1 Tax=Litoribacterium kuwaitense TaxID=1398745 RepID=UPI0013EAD0C4|nr:ribosome biogenesis GTP-binding protein YihA/YsxC [Litoribacterium kuwaitense]NGP45507.1 YihA family ribosome biogenesis GTP-binding protein [Litoribacterium kuwaitense]